MLMIAGLWILPTHTFAATLPLGQTVEIEMPLEAVVATEDLNICNAPIRKQDQLDSFTSKQQLIEKLKTSEEQEVTLSVSNSSKSYTLRCDKQQLFDHVASFQDHVAGVGTLTFLDTETNIYYALGHPIEDQTTRVRPSGKNGLIRLAAVDQVVQSKPKQPGYKVTSPVLPLQLAAIYSNGLYGIRGDGTTIKNWMEHPIEVEEASPKLGRASFQTSIDGQKIEQFTLTIQSVEKDRFLVEVIDEALVARTGGIVQGMSGSPIFQDGKLVGALTHMNSLEPTRGAAITIDQMRENKLN